MCRQICDFDFHFNATFGGSECILVRGGDPISDGGMALIHHYNIGRIASSHRRRVTPEVVGSSPTGMTGDDRAFLFEGIRYPVSLLTPTW